MQTLQFFKIVTCGVLPHTTDLSLTKHLVTTGLLSSYIKFEDIHL